MKYLYTLILTLFLASCSVWNSVENTTSETNDNNTNIETSTWKINKERKVDTFSGQNLKTESFSWVINTENNSWEIMTPPDWDNSDRPEPPEWWDDTERPEPPSRWERNTESWVDTSTSAS